MMREQFIHISEYGDKHYYKDREMTIRHREDGPAIEYENGEECWFINDKLHREDGPAVVYADGWDEWYIDGEEYTEEEFNARMNPVELTLEEIAEKFGVSVDQLKIKK